MTTVSITRSVGGLTFDATFSERHTRELNIVESPVERGSVIADHAFMEPKSLTITAGVSDNPLAQIPSDPFDNGSGRSKRAYELLCELQRKAEPFNVVTGLALYENMLIRRIETEQTKNNPAALMFTAELREVIITNTKSTAFYPPRQEGSPTRQADPVKDKGVQQSAPVVNQSWLVQIKNAAAEQMGYGS